jgi:predicted phosphoribosyltransferase
MFVDRTDAGKQLAEALVSFEDKQPVILALPRGGLPVGFEIAKKLRAPLDIVLVRKIGAPWQPELAVAAVVNGENPEMVINEEIAHSVGASDAYLQKERVTQLAEIERRRTLYLGDRARPTVRGKTAILVDDGIATGATCRAALHAVRRAQPKHLVLAVPLAPTETLSELEGEADTIICLERPMMLGGIGAYYHSFDQLKDSEVIYYLAEAARLLEMTEEPASPVATAGDSA